MRRYTKNLELLLLSLILLGFLQPGALYAQPVPFTCTAASAVPPAVRASGVSELVGDILVTCTGGVPTANGVSIPAVNFTIFFNTAVTNKPLSGSWSEALLILDEPGTPGHSFSQAPCQSSNGVCTNSGNGYGRYNVVFPTIYPYYVAPASSGPNVNVFQGIHSGNQVVFTGIPVDAPGAGYYRTFRFTNIRVNAAALSVPESGPGIVQSLISASGAVSVPINNPVQMSAFVFPDISFSVLDANGNLPDGTISLAQCASRTNQKIATLRFAENFGTAFKKRNSSFPEVTSQNTPGTVYSTESGFFSTAFIGNAARGDLSKAGLADFGTRLKAVFTGVPQGVTLYVDVNGTDLAGGSSTAQLVASETGPFSAVNSTGGGPNGAAAVDSSGTVVWEVTSTDIAASEALDFGVYASYSYDKAANSPATGVFSVSASLAPQEAAGAASTVVPRFSATPAASQEFASLVSADCEAPVLTLGGKKSQGVGQAYVSVSGKCTEACNLTATGTVRIAGSKKTYALNRASQSAGASVSKSLKLRMKTSARKAISTALSKGKHVTAKVSVSALDASGNSSSKTRQVTITR